MRSTSFTALCLIVLAAAVTRIIPHWPNFTPILAMALVAGSFASSRKAMILIPLAAMVVSDLLLGVLNGWSYTFHETQIWVYASVAAVALIGRLFASRSNAQTVFVGGTIAGLLFYVVTNAAVWFSGTMYPHTITGLAQSYLAGLAFYSNAGNYLLNGVVSTWLYTYGMLFVLDMLRKPLADTASA